MYGLLSEATLHRWRAQYGRMKSEEAKRLKQLEDENRRLKQIVADTLISPSTYHLPPFLSDSNINRHIHKIRNRTERMTDQRWPTGGALHEQRDRRRAALSRMSDTSLSQSRSSSSSHTLRNDAHWRSVCS